MTTGPNSQQDERPEPANVAQEGPTVQTTFDQACPYLGLADDPQTRLLYASPAGFCHRASPEAAVAIGHQQHYCLTSMHTLCPVFTRPEWDPLPSELEYKEPSDRSRYLWLWVGVILVGVFLMVLLFMLML